jgi:DNA-binding response OmpR family regulator
MPTIDGLDVLTALKQDNEFGSIPVAVLSGSADPADVASAYANFANCYIRKPVDLDDFLLVLGGLARFWFSVAERPVVEGNTERGSLLNSAGGPNSAFAGRREFARAAGDDAVDHAVR